MHRVLPRDAFNDANLLKCIGKLTMMVEDEHIDFITFDYDGQPFDIRQDESDGSTHIANIIFYAGGERLNIFRPMNSREIYPLTLTYNDNDYWLFDEKGVFQISKQIFNQQ